MGLYLERLERMLGRVKTMTRVTGDVISTPILCDHIQDAINEVFAARNQGATDINLRDFTHITVPSGMNWLTHLIVTLVALDRNEVVRYIGNALVGDELELYHSQAWEKFLLKYGILLSLCDGAVPNEEDPEVVAWQVAPKDGLG